MQKFSFVLAKNEVEILHFVHSLFALFSII